MTQEQFLEKASWKNRLSGERGYSKRKKNESRNAVAKKKRKTIACERNPEQEETKIAGHYAR